MNLQEDGWHQFEEVHHDDDDEEPIEFFIHKDITPL
jgi:hypothetical protein